MCGICGILGFAGPPAAEAVEEMAAALAHRGPDEGSVDAFGACVLGHRRLRVIDLHTGSQPVASEDGSVVAVLNGEIYNFRELRRDLAARGHEVRGTGDTPVLPHLYEDHGPAFVERLEGMFALALWDQPRRRLVLARDRVGKKPLLTARLPDGALAFASELKGLLALPELDRRLDLRALDDFLALGYVPGVATPLASVRRVPPAHVLVVDPEGERLERYWRLQARPEELPEDEWLERVRAAVTDAVRRRLVADVPIGALLSGGIDSSIVVATAAQASAEPLRTFSVGFPDARYDERRYARAVADRYATVHEEVEIEVDVLATLPRLAAAFDEPFGDESALPTFLVCERARESVTVALTGDGGDEAFAGYERYLVQDAAARLDRVAPLARAAARALRRLPAARGERRAPLFRAARLLDVVSTPPADRYGRVMEVFSAAERRALWSDAVRAELVEPTPAAQLLPGGSGITGLQLLDAETYLPGDLLVKADIASMAHSLELRSPFLDHHVLELGVSLPRSLKVRGRTGKRALRLAFAADLPPEVARRGKRGFGVPIARWFREDLRDLAGDLLLGPDARERGLLRPAAVERLLAEHAAGHADHGHRLWCLLMLELWQRTWIERPLARAAA